MLLGKLHVATVKINKYTKMKNCCISFLFFTAINNVAKHRVTIYHCSQESAKELWTLRFSWFHRCSYEKQRLAYAGCCTNETIVRVCTGQILNVVKLQTVHRQSLHGANAERTEASEDAIVSLQATAPHIADDIGLSTADS